MATKSTHVLMYHDVVPDDAAGEGRYALPWSTFVAHLDGIGRAVSGLPGTVDANSSPLPPWALTFDDGEAGCFAAGEEVSRRKWLGHFFVITNRIGEPGYLDAPAISELRRMGHVIGSHSASHPPRISSLSDAELLDEWRTSVAVLSDQLGEPVRTASVPGGYFSARVAAAAARAGITTLFTSEPVRAVRQAGECLVVGRFSVKSNTSVRDAARAAAGHPAPWLVQYVGWNIRKPVKAVAGDHYMRVRRAVLAAQPRRRTS